MDDRTFRRSTMLRPGQKCPVTSIVSTSAPDKLADGTATFLPYVLFPGNHPSAPYLGLSFLPPCFVSLIPSNSELRAKRGASKSLKLFDEISFSFLCCDSLVSRKAVLLRAMSSQISVTSDAVAVRVAAFVLNDRFLACEASCSTSS